MSRPLRLHLPFTPYHLVARGNAKQCIFEDAIDHERFLELLTRALRRFAALCIAYCLLGSHYHLLVIPSEHSVSRLMQQLNSTYCQWFNRRHRRVGHVLQGRFGSRIIDNDAYLLTAIRYIALNPVIAEQVERPEDWRWSSYRAAVGAEQCAPFLSLDPVWRALDAPNAQVGRQRLISFTNADTVSQGLGELSHALFFGSEGLAQKVDLLLQPHRDTVDFTYAERFATRPALPQILAGVSVGDALEDAVRHAFCRHAYTLREIAAVIGRPAGTVWSWIQRAEGRAEAVPGGVRSQFSNSEPT